MQPVRWDELQDFLAVARAGRISHAAEQLGVDATTVSRRLRRLQARLGQTLLEQTRTGQVLTADGQRMLRHVETMQRAADRIVDTAREPHGLSGVLNVSLSEGFGTWFVAQHIGAFAERHPALTIELAATSGFLNPSRRETDVAVLLARPQGGPVVSNKLSDYRLRIYASDDYLHRHGRPQTPQSLAGSHRLIGYIPDMLYAPELNYLNELASGLQTSLRSTSINAQHQMIAAGIGIGVLPCFIGDSDPALRVVVPDIVLTRTFWMVTHADTRRLARIRSFCAWLMDTVGAHQARLKGDATEDR